MENFVRIDNDTLERRTTVSKSQFLMELDMCLKDKEILENRIKDLNDKLALFSKEANKEAV